MITEFNKKNVPMNPKWAKYSPDGQGKEEYIRFDNGGLSSKIYKNNSKDNNIQMFNNMKYYNLRKNLAPIKYHSDGSGRDFYVVHESGGLERNYKTLSSYNLVDILRKKDYKPLNTILIENRKKQGENIEKFFTTDKEKKHNNVLKNLNKDLIERLYNTESHKFLNIDNKKR